MIEAIVINRLLKWQKWKLKVVDPLGYPKQSPFTRLTPSGSNFHDPNVDTDCLLTDKAVDLLPEVYKLVIRLEYIEPIPSEDQRVRCYGKARRTYRDDRSEAYRLLGNLIESLISAEECLAEIA